MDMLFELHTIIFTAQIYIYFGIFIFIISFFMKQLETFASRHVLQTAAVLLAARSVVVVKVVMFSFFLSSFLPVAAGYSLC